MAKFGVKQSDFSKGLTVTGSLVISGSQTITGSITSTTGFTGSLLGTSSFATSASQATSASNAHLLDGYHSSAFPRLAISNTFTADQQVLISGSKEIGTFEGDTFFILDTVSNAEIGLSNALSDFDGPYTAGIYVSSGSYFSTSSYFTAIEIPNGVNFPSGGLVSIKFPTEITGSLEITNGASGSFSGSFEGDGSGLTNISASSIVGLNLARIASGSVTASVDPAYGFKVNASASISGSLNVQGTITATTLVVQTITSSQELVTGSLIVSGSLEAYGGVTGSLQGTASWANNATTASYALVATSASYASASTTASYALFATSASYTETASYVNPLSQSVIISGSLSLNSTTSSGFVSNADTLIFVGTASFSGLTSVTSSLVIENQTNPASLFLIKSGSTEYFNVSSSGNVTIYSNLFIIKNFTNQQPVLTVSQSIVQFATQSSNPSGTAPNGGIWFTSTNMYVGLD
jgi:hypothetical protein